MLEKGGIPEDGVLVDGKSHKTGRLGKESMNAGRERGLLSAVEDASPFSYRSSQLQSRGDGEKFDIIKLFNELLSLGGGSLTPVFILMQPCLCLVFFGGEERILWL